MGLLFIVAFPLSKLFELFIGHEEQAFFGRSELKELFDQHSYTETGKESVFLNEEGPNKGSALSDVELRIIRGMLFSEYIRYSMLRCRIVVLV
jgi:hypothetical protein